MTAPPNLDPKLRNRLTRYLHTGNETPIYYPGCWSTLRYFNIDKLPLLQEELDLKTYSHEVANIILEAYQDGLFTRFETIAFALAKALTCGENDARNDIYKAANQVCNTVEEFLLFNRFCKFLKTGNGKGWCNHIEKWYTSKEPLELAKEVTRVRARHGRSHKLLLSKAHVKIPDNDYARNAIVKYVIFGLKKAKQAMGDAQGTKEIFDYIQKVEDMRHCEDPTAAAIIAEQNHFTLDHVPGHLLTSQEVWDAILPAFSMHTLLSNIQRIHNMGFLTEDSTTTAILCSLLTNKDVINKSKITAIEVYITICNYKQCSKPMKHGKAKIAAAKQEKRRLKQTYNTEKKVWEWTVTRRHPKEEKYWGIDQPPNKAVLAALQSLLNESWNLTAPTKQRYLITMDMRDHMFRGRQVCEKYVVPKKSKTTTEQGAAVNGGGGDADNAPPRNNSKRRQHAECFYNTHVVPAYAAVITMLHLLKREKQVKVAVFTEGGVHVVDTRKCNTIDGTLDILKKAKLGRVQMDAPIEWASKTNEKFDVFINIIDRATRYMELDLKDRGGRGPGGRFGPPPTEEGVVDHCPVRALERYRSKVSKPNAKLIVMSLASHRVATTDGSHEGVLDIVGIDEHVPKVMDAFVLGQFK